MCGKLEKIMVLHDHFHSNLSGYRVAQIEAGIWQYGIFRLPIRATCLYEWVALSLNRQPRAIDDRNVQHLS